MQTEIQVVEKMPRDTMVELLAERDGTNCMYPTCGKELNFSATLGEEVTIDHWIPKSYGILNGWTWDQIWDLDNLKLMHKRCNAKKGDLLPNADGSIPLRAPSKFRNRRAKRVGRPEICTSCNAGRDLSRHEVCATCQHGAAPLRFPRWAKMPSPECDHEMFWCWACSIGIVERASAEQMIYLHDEGGE